MKEKIDEEILAMVGKAGFTQDAALGNELAEEYFLQLKEDCWKCHYFTCTYDLYSDWGAVAKLEHQEHHHSQCLDSRGQLHRQVSTNSSRWYWLSSNKNDIFTMQSTLTC